MSDAIARAVIQAEVNADGVEAGISKVEKSLDSLGARAVSTGKTASAGIDKIGEGGSSASAKVDAATKNMIAAIQRQTAATEAGSRSNAEYYKTLASQRGVNPETLKPYLAQLEAATVKQKNYGKSANEMAFAMRGLPAQFTDIAVSLQGGQRPMTVLLQQGGQLKDMFGGIGPAAKAMGSYVAGIAPMLVHPFTLAVAGVALYAKAVYDASEQNRDMGKALISTGNMAGMTKSQIIGVADDVGKLTGKYDMAREAALELAKSGQFSGDQIKVAMAAAVNGAVVTGKSVTDMVEAFSAISKDPVKGVSDLNDKYNFLTQSVYAQIKALQDQGREQEAVTLAIKTFGEVMSSRKDQVVADAGYIVQAWIGVKKAIDSAQSSLLAWGRDDTLKQKIDKAKATLAEMEGSGNPALKQYIEDEKAYIAQLEEADKVAKQNAKSEGEKARAQKDGIEGLKELDKFQDKYKSKQSEINKLNEAWARAQKGLTKGTSEYAEAQQNYNRGLDQINKKYSNKDAISAAKKEQSSYESLISSVKTKIEANQLEMKTGLDATESQKMQIKFDNDLATGKLKLNSAHKAEVQAQLDKLKVVEKANMQQRFAIEYDNQYQRTMRDMISSHQLEMDSMGLSAEAAEKLAASTKILANAEEAIREGRRKGTVSDDYAAKMREMAQAQSNAAIDMLDEKNAKQKDPWFNASESIRKYGEDASNTGKQIGEVISNGFRSAEDALVQFTTTGKLSFSNFAKSIISDLARMQAKSAISGAGKGLNEAIANAFSYSEDEYVDVASAKGNIFSSGNVIPFAKGGSFTNSIASRTTVAPMAMFGEAGPEAIMPLTRGADGSLGVKSSGSGTSVVINNHTGAQATTKQTTDSNGNRRLEVVIGDMVAGEVRRNGSSLNSAYKQTFGARAALTGR